VGVSKNIDISKINIPNVEITPYCYWRKTMFLLRITASIYCLCYIFSIENTFCWRIYDCLFNIKLFKISLNDLLNA